MGDECRDMKGNSIFVGCHVSDGIVAGTVTEAHKEQVWFTAEGSIGKPIRGRLFSRPENLLVILDGVWKRVMG